MSSNTMSVALIGTLGCTGLGELPEPSPELPTVTLTGRLVDYFASEPVANINIETVGLAPEVSGGAGSSGAFTLLAIPEASIFFSPHNRNRPAPPNACQRHC